MKAQASKFCESVLLLLVMPLHSSRYPKFLKLTILSRFHLVRASGQKYFKRKTGPAPQEAGPYKGVTHRLCHN